MEMMIPKQEKVIVGDWENDSRFETVTPIYEAADGRQESVVAVVLRDGKPTGLLVATHVKFIPMDSERVYSC